MPSLDRSLDSSEQDATKCILVCGLLHWQRSTQSIPSEYTCTYISRSISDCHANLNYTFDLFKPMRVQLRTGYFYQHHVPALSFGCIRRHEIEEQRSQQEKNTRQVYNLHLDVVQCTSRSPRFLSSIQYDRELGCTHQGWHMHLSNGVCRVVSRRHDSYVRAPNINTI